MASVLNRVILAAASAGGLLPLWAAVESVLSYTESELLPRVAGQVVPLNSFPYIHFAKQCFAISFVWLGSVVALWAFFFSRGQK